MNDIKKSISFLIKWDNLFNIKILILLTLFRNWSSIINCNSIKQDCKTGTSHWIDQGATCQLCQANNN